MSIILETLKADLERSARAWAEELQPGEERNPKLVKLFVNAVVHGKFTLDPDQSDYTHSELNYTKAALSYLAAVHILKEHDKQPAGRREIPLEAAEQRLIATAEGYVNEMIANGTYYGNNKSIEQVTTESCEIVLKGVLNSGRSGTLKAAEENLERAQKSGDAPAEVEFRKAAVDYAATRDHNRKSSETGAASQAGHPGNMK